MRRRRKNWRYISLREKGCRSPRFIQLKFLSDFYKDSQLRRASRASAARSGSEGTLYRLCKDSGSQKWSRHPWGLLVKAKEVVITNITKLPSLFVDTL